MESVRMYPVYSQALGLFKKQPPSTRRQMPSTSKACTACRQAKAKCDEIKPCTRCVRISSKPLHVKGEASTEAAAAAASTTCVLEAFGFSPTQEGQNQRPRKRSAISQSCAACRRSKTKCDEKKPCSRCIKLSWRISVDACARSCDLSVRSWDDASSSTETDASSRTTPEPPSDTPSPLHHMVQRSDPRLPGGVVHEDRPILAPYSESLYMMSTPSRQSNDPHIPGAAIDKIQTPLAPFSELQDFLTTDDALVGPSSTETQHDSMAAVMQGAFGMTASGPDNTNQSWLDIYAREIFDS
jgi:hypothetical protein